MHLHMRRARHHPQDRLRHVARLEDLEAAVERRLRARRAREHVGELGEHVPGGDGGHADRALLRAQLLAERLGERAHGELGGRVHAALRPGHAVRRHRRHVHDVPRHPAPLHVLDRLAGGDGQAQDVHLEHLGPELRRRRAERRGAAQAGIVDQDVDAAEALARDREEAADVFLAPHVGRLHRDPFATELRRETREAIGAPRGERHRRAGRRERACRLAPDAARGTGDDRALAREQTRHGGLLRPLDLVGQRCDLTRMPVDLKAVGKKLGAVTHTYTERDVMLYALGVGCGTDDLQFTYERDLRVLPTFAVIPSFPAMLNLGGAMDVNPAMVLHGEQRIELHAEIPTSGTITTTPMVKAIYDKGKGALVVVETESVDQKGRLLFRNTSGIFARGEGGFGGERGPSGPRNTPPDRPPDKSIAMKTLPQQALLYRLSGDMNPLHADPDFAKLGGYDRPILHGLCTFGHAGRAVLKAYCRDDPAELYVESSVLNTGTRVSRDVKVSVEALDAQGIRLAETEVYPTPQDIPPGGAARFVARLRNDPAIRTFHVEAIGR